LLVMGRGLQSAGTQGCWGRGFRGRAHTPAGWNPRSGHPTISDASPPAPVMRNFLV